MKERIYLAPTANGTELRKSLAMHGINCLNVRVCGAPELARIALMRAGIAITDAFISPQEELPLIAEAVKDETFFKKPTYSDITAIAAAIRCMRGLVPDTNEEKMIAKVLPKGFFTEKNNALLSIYQKYMQLLEERKLIDQISLVRKALMECEPIYPRRFGRIVCVHTCFEEEPQAEEIASEPGSFLFCLKKLLRIPSKCPI